MKIRAAVEYSLGADSLVRMYHPVRVRTVCAGRLQLIPVSTVRAGVVPSRSRSDSMILFVIIAVILVHTKPAAPVRPDPSAFDIALRPLWHVVFGIAHRLEPLRHLVEALLPGRPCSLASAEASIAAICAC